MKPMNGEPLWRSYRPNSFSKWVAISAPKAQVAQVSNCSPAGAGVISRHRFFLSMIRASFSINIDGAPIHQSPPIPIVSMPCNRMRIALKNNKRPRWPCGLTYVCFVHTDCVWVCVLPPQKRAESAAESGSCDTGHLCSTYLQRKGKIHSQLGFE